MDNVDLVIIYLQSKNAFYLKATDVEIAAAVAIKGILDRQPLQRTDGSSEGYPWIRILRVPLDSY